MGCKNCGDRTAIAEHLASVASANDRVAEWLLPGIRDPLPTPIIDARNEWWRLTNFDVRDAHAGALHELAQIDAGQPQHAEGRGLIYVGGDNPNGWRSGEYGLQVAVGIRMARRFGWNGPIEWWHDSNVDRIRHYITPDMGDVRVRDFRQIEPLPRMIRGLPNKLTAIAHSSFRDVLFLDADAYLVTDPSPLWDLLNDHGFAYWCKGDQWAFEGRIAPGVDIKSPHGVQGGQMVIDRVRAWHLIVIAHWINQHSDYYYAEKVHKQVRWFQFGDEDAWAIGMGMLEHYKKPTCWHSLGGTGHSMGVCQMRHAGKVRIVHRPNDKMHSGGWTPTYPKRITEELAAYEEMEEVIRGAERNALGVAPGWRYRKRTNDLEIFNEVAVHNEYKLPDDMSGWTVLDVGANTGSFGWACGQRFAGRIVMVEPHPDTLIITRWNAERHVPNSEVHGVALWEGPTVGLKLRDYVHGNTGMATIAADGEIDVPVESFDAFYNRVFGDTEIDLAKFDCERAEIPILMLSRLIGKIRRLACEIHAGAGKWDETIQQLTNKLESFGFEVETDQRAPQWGQGHLFAKRKF